MFSGLMVPLVRRTHDSAPGPQGGHSGGPQAGHAVPQVEGAPCQRRPHDAAPCWRQQQPGAHVLQHHRLRRSPRRRRQHGLQLLYRLSRRHLGARLRAPRATAAPQATLGSATSGRRATH